MPDENDLKVRIPVVPELDKRAVGNLHRDLEKLKKDLGGVNLNYKELAKVSDMNIKGLRKLADGAEALGNNLTGAAQKAFNNLGKTAKRIEMVGKKASKLEKEASAAGASGDMPAQAKAEKSYADMTKTLSRLNTQLERQKKVAEKHRDTLERSTDAQMKNIRALNQAARFKPGDAAKGMFSGIGKALTSGGSLSGTVAGVKEAAGSASRGVSGVKARSALSGGGGGEMAMLGKAAGVMSGAAIAIGVFVQILMAASSQMTKLNKALITGTGLANDLGMSNKAYRQTVDNIRTSAIDARGSLIKLGMDSEQVLQTINSFGKNATGSLAKTEVQMKQFGGVELFAKNMNLYGRALGMGTSEMAGMMGNMVSDIGYSADNAMSTIQGLVKTASTSGMPVHKFMDVFNQVLPDIDMFTNRIEQLTGTIKVLSKTMSAGDVKNFMQAMGKGFDQMDFKQRLKMAFVIGPGKVAKMLNRDFTASGKAISAQFGDLSGDVQAALKTADPVKAMAEVTSKAAALGVSSAAIGDAQFY